MKIVPLAVVVVITSLSATGCTHHSPPADSSIISRAPSVSTRPKSSPKMPPHLPDERKQPVVAYNKKAFASLIKAIQRNDLKFIKALLKKGADPNIRNAAGMPYLIVAVSRGYAPIVSALLDKGADINVKGSLGMTALLESMECGRDSMTRYLISRGANVNASYSCGVGMRETALTMATRKGKADIVKVLLEAGADINVTSYFRDTVLHTASGAGYKTIVEMLLQKGAAVDCRDGLGATPLMKAVNSPLQSRAAIVEYLIAKGADVNARDNVKWLYPVKGTYAKASRGSDRKAKSGDIKVLYQIRKSGNLNVPYNGGHHSVLDYADEGGDEQIVALLKKAGAKS